MSDGLGWVRLDANIGTNRKVIRLLSMRNGPRAFVLYITALGWSGGHGTDGHVPAYLLPMLHGTRSLASSLVECDLWDEVDDGYAIRNYADRQELARVTEAKQQGRRRAICTRWMRDGRPCSCGEHE